MALPRPLRVIGFDREGPVTGLASTTAVEETLRADRVTDLLQLGKRDAVERGGLFKGHLRHEVVNIQKAWFFAGHDGRKIGWCGWPHAMLKPSR